MKEKKKGLIQISVIQKGNTLIDFFNERKRKIKNLCNLAVLKDERRGQKECEIKCNLPGEIKGDAEG